MKKGAIIDNRDATLISQHRPWGREKMQGNQFSKPRNWLRLL